MTECKCGTCCKDCDKRAVRRVTQVFAGLFECTLPGGLVAENIMFGARYGVQQATVEIHEDAVPHLIALCDELSAHQGMPWRLVKFDENGIQELEPNDYREMEGLRFSASMQ